MRAITGATALKRYALLEAEGRYVPAPGAQPQEVIVKFGAASLTLFTLSDEPIDHWALGSLRADPAAADPKTGHAEALTLMPDADAPERLTIADRDMIAALEEVCPDLRRPPRAPRRRWRRLAWIAAALALAGALSAATPAALRALAMRAPIERTAALGRALAQAAPAALGPEARLCAAPDGVAALDRLARRLTPALDAAPPARLAVVDWPARNAAALPGGWVLILRGLIDAARTPEELAAAVAHELAHAARRAPLDALLRAGGPRESLRLLTGGLPGPAEAPALAQALLRARHDARAEAGADAAALDAFAKAGLPASAMAALLETLARDPGPAPRSHLSRDPEARARAARARAADVIGASPFRPALEDGDWVALRQICD
ncbi:M48 family metalloprotease [Oceanicella actignis]|uniref:M48 family metalloprotease n=1 Tax=Oceanicella actignis TaxID=1189325 RepID=UPI0011E711E0|nr:M48 family metalloprotease [Oceanicella actignis]TYO88822.1 peptidase M48-like protein [Oceanicella actignis]